MSIRSEFYYKNCRENSTGKYYKNYPEKMQILANTFDKNYNDMEFFRKHIPKIVPFAEPKHILFIKNLLSHLMKEDKDVYIVKADGKIQRARICRISKTHYTRKVFDIKSRQYITINHQLRKVLGVYDASGNTIWEYMDWANQDIDIIVSNQEKILRLITLNKKEMKK